MSSRINILIPDGDSTWALSVIQCLSRVEAYKLFVLSNKKRTATKYSKHISYYKFYKRGTDQDWLNTLEAEITSNNIAVLLPIAEAEISFCLRYRQPLGSLTKIMPLPRLEDYGIAIDKKRLSEFCVSNHIPHPKSLYVKLPDEKQILIESMSFPWLIKPLCMKGGDGIVLVKSVSDLDNLQQSSQPILIQEYVEGYDIDCSVLCKEGTIMAYTIQKGNLKGHNQYAPQLGFDFVKNEAVLEVVTSAMSKLNWSGIAHLDLRYDAQAKNYKLIEINGRFWGSIEASKKAGINFPHLVVQSAIGNVISTTDYELISYMRLKGVIKAIKRNPSFLLKRTYMMNHTEVRSFLRDPLPTLYKFREWFGRQFQ